jgi:hypothetical protein
MPCRLLWLLLGMLIGGSVEILTGFRAIHLTRQALSRQGFQEMTIGMPRAHAAGGPQTAGCINDVLLSWDRVRPERAPVRVAGILPWEHAASGFSLVTVDDRSAISDAAQKTMASGKSPCLCSRGDLRLGADSHANGRGELLFSTGGIERLHIANDGNVGIGITKPESKFDTQAQETDTVIARFGREDGGTFQSLIEMRTQKTLIHSGSEIGRGTIRLIDTVASPNRTMELGYYEYGAGLFTHNLFEFWTNGVSIAGIQEPAFLAVRDTADRSEIRLEHDGTQGIMRTNGWAPGGIQMGGNGPNIFLTRIGEVMRVTDNGNIGIGTASEFGAGAGVVGIANTKTSPMENPIGGGILYVEDGELKYRGPSGTVTTLAGP